MRVDCQRRQVGSGRLRCRDEFVGNPGFVAAEYPDNNRGRPYSATPMKRPGVLHRASVILSLWLTRAGSPSSRARSSITPIFSQRWETSP